MWRLLLIALPFPRPNRIPKWTDLGGQVNSIRPSRNAKYSDFAAESFMDPPQTLKAGEAH
jgi:hypothetical protein